MVTHTALGDRDVPLGNTEVKGSFNSDIASPSVTPWGSKTSWDVTTSNAGGFFNNDALAVQNNVYMPASWNISFYAPANTCVDQSSSGYSYLSVPINTTVTLQPGPDSSHDSILANYCYTDPPGSAGIAPGPVDPQVILDSSYPSVITVSSTIPTPTSAAATHLRVYNTSLTNVSNMAGLYTNSNGSVSYDFPVDQNGHNLPAGGYAIAITSDPSGQPQQTLGVDSFFIAHDDRSFTGAFGVAVVPATTTEYYTSSTGDPYGDGTCAGSTTTTDTFDPQTEYPIVTLVNQGKIALGSTANTLTVGTSPSQIVLFNDQGGSDYEQRDACDYTITNYSGPQSALVVNTGSNSVTIVGIGGDARNFPSGTVSVGTAPVAAVVNSAETLAYVANYGSNTISEVDLNSLVVTRSLSVMTHPSALAFDVSGNLWVGGQGAMDKVSISSWSVTSSTSVDGSVQAMAYDSGTSAFIQTLLQNGSSSSPSARTTMAHDISYSRSSGSSYTAGSMFYPSSLTSSVGPFGGDNAAYSNSSISSSLAYPGQVANAPPVMTSSNGDVTATVTGTNFTISRLSDGVVLVSGSLPYAPRSVALGNTGLYFTIPESNSLVSIPIVLP
jgi:YVTN family beta-propeller protein